MGRTKHGFSKRGSSDKIYNCWVGIKRRCFNKNEKSYKNYGGRGIVMCDEWNHDFKSFRDWAINNGWQDGLTIERKDVNGNYTPLNCCWIPKALQARNTTMSTLIEYNGERLPASEWAKKTGIGTETIRRRVFKRGWDVERALTTPPESAISSNKITEKDVIEIFKSNQDVITLARLYGVTKSAIWHVKRGTTWSHITGKTAERKNNYPKRRKKRTS